MKFDEKINCRKCNSLNTFNFSNNFNKLSISYKFQIDFKVERS